MQENLATLSIQVLIVTHSRERLLRRLLKELESLISAAELKFEVHVVVNGRDPLTEALLQSLDLPYIKWFLIKNAVSPSAARAEGIVKFGVSSWIWFLDDDVSVPKQTFEAIECMLRKSGSEFDVFGGPNLTPVDSHWRQHVIGSLLENPFVVGPVSQRYRQALLKPDFKSDDRALMLCHLLVRGSRFQSDLFLPGLLCGEENYFLCLLRQRGARMMFFSGIPVFHERREGFGSFLKQIQKYGLGRGQLVRTLGPHRMGWFSRVLGLGLAVLIGSLFLSTKETVLLFLGIYVLTILIALVFLLKSSVRTWRALTLSVLMIPALQFQYLRGLLLGTLRGSGPL